MSTSLVSIEAQLLDAERACAAAGTRLTAKRKRVLLALLQARKAISAYEIVHYVREHFDEPIPPMSVYRMLEFLESNHLVYRLDTANKYVACVDPNSGNTPENDHENTQFLICDGCGKVREVDLAQGLIESLDDCAHNLGFRLKTPRLELHCICDDCDQSVA